MKYLVSCFLVLSFITACVAQNQNESPYRSPSPVELRPSFEPQQIHGYQPKVGPSTNRYHHRDHKPLNRHHHGSRMDKNHGHEQHFQEKEQRAVVVPTDAVHQHNAPRQGHSKNSRHQKVHNGSHD